MKKTLILLLLFGLFFSCKHKTESNKKHELTKAEKEEQQHENAEFELNSQKEKIVLLATIKGLHYDTLYSILKDYYFKLNGDNENDTTILNSLNYTTEKHSFTKSEIASLIFSFRYEMLSKEEIFQNELENNSREYDSEIPENN